MGKVKDLIKLLQDCDPESEIRFAEYCEGRLQLWYLVRCCNTEHQNKKKEVWFSRNLLAETY